MSIRLASVALSLLVALGSVPASFGDSEAPTQTPPELPGKLLYVSVFHGDEITARNGESWFGLFPDEPVPEDGSLEKLPGFHLSTTRIKVNRVADLILDPDSNTKTGKEVLVDASPLPVMLFKNIPALSDGPVETVFYQLYYPEPTDKEFGFVSQQFRLQNRNYRLDFTGDGKTADGFIKDLTVSLSAEADGVTQSQVLQTFPEAASFKESGGPALIWAGDLDRDGKLDLILDMTTHYNMSQMTLFLSSPAQAKGQLLEKVAELITYGC